MTMLCDTDICRRVRRENMIEGFEPNQIKEVKDVRVISYGVSSYGYDMRVGYDFKVFTNLASRIIDPKNFDEKCFTEVVGVFGEAVIIPPHSFALCATVEKFNIPRDILCLCLGKSTYARCGIIVNITPLEPEWVGHLTVEISNTAPLPCKIYPGEGIAQVIFLHNENTNDSVFDCEDHICEKSYADKAGKYMNQPDQVVTARV